MENSGAGTSQPNLPRIKILQTIQGNLSVIGIEPDLAQPWYPLNARNLLDLLLLGGGVISMSMYIFYEAKTFLEITISAYLCCGLTFSVFVLIAMILQSNLIYKLINDFECIVNASKCGNKVKCRSSAVGLPTNFSRTF